MARLPILRRARAALATLRGLLAEEWFLGVGLASSAALLLGGEALTDRLSAPAGLAMLFAWLFVAAFGCCLSVVRHADHLAIRLGEPYGTLILTLAVTTVEVTSISSMVVHGARDPALARDTVFAVIMILLNGMVGLSLLLGGWRHLEQQFNLLGANSYLGVIIPLTALSLLLPNYTLTTAGPTLSASQEIFVAAVALGLYAVFLAVQTIRHRGYFRLVDAGEREDHEPPASAARHPLLHAASLVCYMAPLVFLAERLSAPVDSLLAALRAPASLGGVAIALLVATPEALSAVRAARANRLQRSMNILLGSVLSTIGLTIPVMIGIGQIQGSRIVLGLEPGNAMILVSTLAVSLVTFSSGRTNILQGAVHLVLFGAYVMLLFES